MAIFFLSGPAQAAAGLYFQPDTASIPSGSETVLNLMIDTGGKKAVSADAKINFPQAKIQIKSVSPGSFFGSVSKLIDNQSGDLTINGYFQGSPASTGVAGVGTVAAITVKTLSPGAAPIDFSCSPGETTDTNIVDSAGKDIIDCGQTIGAKLTISAASSDQVMTPTPTPNKLPQAGSAGPTLGLAVIGLTVIMIGLTMILRPARVL